MLVIHHFLITLILGIIALVSGYLNFLELCVFVIGGIFVDIDHIPAYWFYNKEITFSYKKVKKWCFEIGYKMEHFYILHTFWFLLFLFLTRDQNKYMMLIFLAVFLHYSLDIIYDMYWHYILKKNKRPYRRWIAPVSWLKTVKLEKYL